MANVGEELEKAVEGAFTRPIPKSAGAQMRYLVKQFMGSTKQVALSLGITQRTVERYVKDQIKRPRPELAARMEREVRRRWQPQIRARAKRAASTTDGIMIDARARFGFTAAPGPLTTPACATSPWPCLPSTLPASSTPIRPAPPNSSSSSLLPKLWETSTSATAAVAPTAWRSSSRTSNTWSLNSDGVRAELSCWGL